MRVEEYIELWKNQGISNLSDYIELLKTGNLRDNKEFLDNFEEGKINYKNFWVASDKHFGFDPIFNQYDNFKKKLRLDYNINDANNQNYNIVRGYGLDGWCDSVVRSINIRGDIPRVMEIGPGYGSFKQCYINERGLEYVGFDVTSRFQEVVEVEGEDGTLSDEQVDKYRGKFNMAFSSNVFQHLTKNQLRKYIDQTYQLLTDYKYGSAVFMFCIQMVDLPKETMHYGQVISLPTYDEVMNMIRGKFKPTFTMYATNNNFGVMNLLLDKIR